MRQWVPVFAAIVFLVSFLPHSMDWAQWYPWGAQWLSLLGSIGLLAVVAWLGVTRGLLVRIGRAMTSMARLPEAVIVCAAVVLFFLFTAKLGGLVFSHLPHVADTHAQYAQAKIFAAGHLYAPSHPLREFFDTQFFINDGKFYAQYPPGHAFLLAVGHLLGRPWVINPFLGAMTVGAMFYLGKEIGGRQVGFLSMALMFCSPFVVFMSSEYMNHSTALLMVVLFSLFYIRAEKRTDKLSAIGAGLAFGWLFLTRPQNAVVIALPFVIHALWNLRRPTLVTTRIYAVLFLSAVPLLLFFLYYNQQTTGDPLLTGYQKYDTNQVPGGLLWSNQGVEGWWGHFSRAVMQTQALHGQLFCWPVSSLVLVFLLFFVGAERRFCLLLASTFVSTFVGLMFNPFGSTDLFGPRYLYETSGVLIVLTALSLSRMAGIWRKYLSIRVNPAVWRAGVAVWIALMTVTGFFLTTRDLYKTYSNRYWEGDPGMYQLITETVQPPAIVFVKDWLHHQRLAFLLPPDDKAPLILARGLDERNVELMNYYPHRHTYEFVPRQGLRPLSRP